MRMFLVLCALAFSSAAASELRIPVVQDNIILRNGQTIKSSQMGDVLSVLNGYTIQSSDPWKAIKRYDPLHHPTFYLIADFALVEGVTIEMNSNLKFPLVNDEDLDEEFSEFRDRSILRNTMAERHMMAITASDDQDLDSPILSPEVEKTLKNEKFDPKIAADRSFLAEYNTLFSVYKDALNRKTDTIPSTVYWFNLDSIKDLNATYGPTGEKTKRAAELFGDLIGTITGGLESKKGAMFMVILETEEKEILRRSKRQAATETATPAPKETPLTIAYQYGDDYHVVFAITLFVVLVITLGVLATSVGMWFMDPGRDSIIYRMTSTRMKMD